MIFKKLDYKFWFALCILISVLIIAVYNIVKNPTFFDISISNVLTLIVAIIVAYYLSQKKSDERVLKEKFVEILDKIQELVTNDKAYLITEDVEDKDILMLQRRMSKKIDLLKTRSKKVRVKDDVEYMYGQFLEYKDIIGNHLNDKDYLHKSYSELKNKLDLIDDKCDEIKLKLYE